MDSTSLVEFGLTPNFGLSISSGELVSEHKIDLPEGLLLPGTKYYFRVISRNQELEGISEVSSFTTKGYRITIYIKDHSGKPLKEAEVILSLYFGTRKEFTDENGKVEFLDISSGGHVLNINYKNGSLTSEINVQDDKEFQEFEIIFSQSKSLQISKIWPLILSTSILFSAILLLILIFMLKKRKKKELPTNVNLTENSGGNDIREKF